MASLNAPTLGQAEGTVLLVAGGLALLAVLYVVKKGPGAVAQDAAKAAVGAAGAAAVGVVDGTSQAVGLPTTEQTTTDPAVARWMIDNYGYFDASKWSSVSALFNGALMDSGTGTPPPAGTAIATAHPVPATDAAQAAASLQTAPMSYGSDAANPYAW